MKNKVNKLSLDQFKAKSGNNQESLEFISGGILGACHDEPSPSFPKKCKSYTHER